MLLIAIAGNIRSIHLDAKREVCRSIKPQPPKGCRFSESKKIRIKSGDVFPLMMGSFLRDPAFFDDVIDAVHGVSSGSSSATIRSKSITCLSVMWNVRATSSMRRRDLVTVW